MANRFVVVIKANTPLQFGNFTWEVRELLSEASGTVLERSGPTLATGIAETIAEAKNLAETMAENFSLEEVYVYNTATQDPTPPA